MLITYVILSLACIGHQSGLADDDPLHAVLDQMAEADCCRFEFISIIESDVFESVDSTAGTALIGADDRYDLRLGPDRYLRTDEFFYSYSGENAQVTVERVAAAAASDETIRFITRLDHYYEIKWVADKYMLTRKADAESSLPKLILLTLNESDGLGRFFYIDDNGDTNRIVIVASSFSSDCDSAAFVPDFPQATEVIKLY